MASLNKVILIGNLTADPELKQTQSGISVVSFTIATIGATVEKVSTMPNRRRMMFCGFEKYVFTRLYLFTELSAPFI